MTENIICGYAYGKLYEFVFELFTGHETARIKLSENLHFLTIISPSDFKLPGHKKAWKELRASLIGRTKNIGLERHPVERLTVRNQTLNQALTSIWDIYVDCTVASQLR
jgi:hypothetical protein